MPMAFRRLEGICRRLLWKDLGGALWLGFETQGIARRRSDGRFEYFDPNAGWPGGRIRSAHRDAKGRLWFASSTGLWRLDDPTAARPVFRRYTPAEGLSSFTIHSLTTDRQGRVYAGTGLGVDRFDPDSGRIERLSPSDGFPSGLVQAAYCDREGGIWFATRHGLVRLIPAATRRSEKEASARITSIKVRGVDRSLAAAGETDLAGLVLRPGEDQIEFAFTVPQFRASEERRYQYRLEGVRSSAWSPLSTARSVNFVSLAPGSYRFLVRATAANGFTTPAALAFRIRPPFWLTWWFDAGMAMLLAAVVYAVYRYRMQMALEREHLRMRIATDLHDDIGSSLSRIAIWSEVASREAERSAGKLVLPLTRIGDVSREMIDSMSDIVWAVNPKFDRLADLASRMRRYVSDLSAGSNIPISFTAQGIDSEVAVGPELRRQVFLVLKEALNNVLRHSKCTQCTATLSTDSGWIILQVCDEGKGFDAAVPRFGNGLDNMTLSMNIVCSTGVRHHQGGTAPLEGCKRAATGSCRLIHCTALWSERDSRCASRRRSSGARARTPAASCPISRIFPIRSSSRWPNAPGRKVWLRSN